MITHHTITEKIIGNWGIPEYTGFIRNYVSVFNLIGKSIKLFIYCDTALYL